MNELPFMATENIMMDAVKRGGNRQDLHERIREHSMAAGKRIKEEGLENDMVDPHCRMTRMFGMTREQISSTPSRPSATYRPLPSQVDEFLNECVRPAIAPYLTGEDVKVEIKPVRFKPKRKFIPDSGHHIRVARGTQICLLV